MSEQPCQACGRPTSSNDPAMEITASELTGMIIHSSHTTDPRSGFYQYPVRPA